MSILFGEEWRDKKMHIENGGQYIFDFGISEKNMAESLESAYINITDGASDERASAANYVKYLSECLKSGKLQVKWNIRFKTQKEIKDIEFNYQNVYGETMKVSEPIVMASAAGWYVGKICKTDGFVEPFDRFTEYFATPEEANVVLTTPEEMGGFGITGMPV